MSMLSKSSIPNAIEVDLVLAAAWSFLGHGPAPIKGIEALRLYHPSQFKHQYGNLSSWAALAALGGDAFLYCPSRKFARYAVQPLQQQH